MPVDKFGNTNSTLPTTTREIISLSYMNNTFLRKDGGVSASGPLNMGDNRIESTADPLVRDDVATKNYVDNIAIDGKLSTAGDAMEGDLDMSQNRIIGLPPPINIHEATNKAYVDSILEFSNPLNMNRNRIVDLSPGVSMLDATNLSQLQAIKVELTIKINMRTQNLDMGGNKIINCSNGVDPDDLVTVGQISNSFVKNNEGNLDMDRRKIINCLDGTTDSDVITFGQFQNILMQFRDFREAVIQKFHNYAFYTIERRKLPSSDRSEVSFVLSNSNTPLLNEPNLNLTSRNVHRLTFDLHFEKADGAGDDESIRITVGGNTNLISKRLNKSDKIRETIMVQNVFEEVQVRAVTAEFTYFLEGSAMVEIMAF